jgi:hypothetical protein
MDKSQKTKAQKVARQANVLESLKDIGNSAGQSLKRDLFEGTSEDLLKQLFGELPKSKKYSGEINPGESLNLSEVYAGTQEENQKLRRQISYERQLSAEEKGLIERKSNDLKLQLHALTQEVLTLAKTTQNLGQNIEVAAMQAPANPGIYHVVFFEKLLEFIQSFRKKIEDASLWLNSSNKRAEKKNYWAMYKKKGSSFLLSPDHYLQRSAG